MTRPRHFFLLAATLGFTSGCGGGPPAPEFPPVNGTVAWKNAPLDNAVVSFVPDEDPKAMPGNGRTNEKGEFTLNNPRGGTGVPEGAYKVTVSRRVFADGKVVPADDMTPPIESTARESLPPEYSDPEQTTIKLKVKSGEPIRIDLK